MQKARQLLLSLGLLTSLSCQASGLTGNYSASGTNPGGRGQYQGRVLITQDNEIYHMEWQVGGDYKGTGIRTGNVLSVAYTDAKGKWFGVVSYQILDNGRRLQGQWCAHKGSSLGTELLIKQP
jgi:hypothetical protein